MLRVKRDLLEEVRSCYLASWLECIDNARRAAPEARLERVAFVFVLRIEVKKGRRKKSMKGALKRKKKKKLE